MTNHGKITTSEALSLAQIILWANKTAKVTWSEDGGDTIREGVARHIVKGPDNFGFLNGSEDVRDGHLRITTLSGMETTLPVDTIVSLMGTGLFHGEGRVI